MTNNGHKVWGGVLSTLKSQVSASNYKTWFSGSKVLDFKESNRGNILVVAVGNNFVKEQIESRFYGSIAQIVKDKGFGECEIVFVVSQKQSRDVSGAPLFSGIAQEHLTPRKFDTLNTNHTFGNFVVGGSNNLAYLASTQVCSQLGLTYNPLFVWGPTGVGKTHLLQAIGNEVLAKVADAKVLYATSEKFTNDFLDSLRNRDQAQFRQKYRSVNLLIIDDVQFLAGKEGTQDEFFHAFNEFVLSGRQVVLASDKHPRDLNRLRERLVSRFLGGMVVDIGLPDVETKMLIVKSKCEERGINLDAKVVERIARECVGGARELEGVLTNVLAHIRMTGSSTNTDDVLAAVFKNEKESVSNLNPKDVIGAVSRHFKVSVEDLRGSSRKSRLVFARQIAMYLLRQNLKLSLDEVGRALGDRDHSTVIYGVSKVDSVIKSDLSVRDEVLRVKSLLNI